MVKIHCVNTGTTSVFTEGTTLLDMLQTFGLDKDRNYPIIAAKVNNVCQGLKYRAFNSRQVEFIDYTSYSGRSVYCSSLCFLLCKAAKDVFPGCRIILRRPISKGYYCTLETADGNELTQSHLDMICAKMSEIVEADIPFRRHEVLTDEAIEMFRSLGYEYKARLLETSAELYTKQF